MLFLPGLEMKYRVEPYQGEHNQEWYDRDDLAPVKTSEHYNPLSLSHKLLEVSLNELPVSTSVV
jgi:hypothetical protein